MTWWSDVTVYEVYLPSFLDSNGDGFGDLVGVTARLDYIADLGVDAIWITPFYPSPMRDNGYDITDYCAVDAQFGTIDEFDCLVTAAHHRGLRVIIDLVVNHTSSLHPWFISSRQDRQSPHRDYYIWRDASPDGGPPNNWTSHFGGSAWTRDQFSDQYWLHLFLPDQPDLNWRNEQVIREVDQVLVFWLGRGVDGFRIDVAHGMIKDDQLRDNPPSPDANNPRVREFHRTIHKYDHDRPEVHGIYRHWREVVAPFDCLLLGEVNIDDVERVARYADSESLHAAMWFGIVESDWRPVEIAAMLRRASEPGHELGWVQSSHDRPRSVTRFGGGEDGRRRSLVLATVMSGLPKLMVMLQGEELGLSDGVVSSADGRDLPSLRDPLARSRDGSRTGMPWTTGPHMGFTSGTPWLHAEPRPAPETAESQTGSADSWLTRWTELLRAKRMFRGAGPIRWMSAPAGIVHYRRGIGLVVANLTETPVAIKTGCRELRLAFAAGSACSVADDCEVTLGPETAALLEHQS